MNRINWKKRTGWLMLAVLLAVSPTMGASANSLKEAKEEKKQLEESLKEAKALVDTLKDSKTTIEKKVTELDGKLTEISEDITELETQIEEKNTEIKSGEEALALEEAKEKEQYAQMKIRIQYMYENRQSSYAQQLLNAESFSEFLNAVEYIRQISEYDRMRLKEYQQTQAEIIRLQEKLEAERTELETIQAQVKNEKNAVEVLMDAKESELAQVKGDINKASALVDVYAAEIQAQQEIIEQIKAAEAKKRAEEAKKQEQQQYKGGIFLWPCPSSYRITSEYGNRISPTVGASSDHKGIDIGAAYGADIVAAADGTVIFAGYGNASGNYVMLDHGGSVYTVYMHASALCVSNGEQVTQGQVIAKVGSTGVSTGNHLHFGVSENGNYVSPWNYLSR